MKKSDLRQGMKAQTRDKRWLSFNSSECAFKEHVYMHYCVVPYIVHELYNYDSNLFHVNKHKSNLDIMKIYGNDGTLIFDR